MAPEGTLLYPEFARLRAELLLASGDAESGVRQLQTVIDAAMSLVRLQPNAAKMLRGIYEAFAEGLDTADLAEARAVLARFETPVS